MPGGAVPPLADMLIKGEGGPVDAQRAVTLLKTKASDVPGVRAAYGQLLLDGKIVPRDVKDGVNRILIGAQFDLDRLLQGAQLLAVNPDVKVSNPTGFLFNLTEAAELREPGFVAALADLKLSEHPQFADKAGACALIAAAETQRRHRLQRARRPLPHLSNAQRRLRKLVARFRSTAASVSIVE